MVKPEVITHPSVAEAAATLFETQAHVCVAQTGSFRVVLSGGSTPGAMYALLRGRDLPWGDIHVYWGDERFVPHDHPDSNYGAARRDLLDAVPIPTDHVHPWPFVPDDPEAAARMYAQTLPTPSEPAPLFDLVFLGLGEDAHTASLFPDTDAVHARGLTVVVRPPGKGVRLSLTAGALSRTRTVAFLVTGESKRGALEATLTTPHNPTRYPAQAISALERLLWLTDLTIP